MYLTAILAFVLVVTSNYLPLSQAATDGNDNRSLKELTDGNNHFTGRLYKQIAQENDDNVLVSPISIDILLAYLQSGCGDVDAKEIRDALDLPRNKKDVESAMKAVLPQLMMTNRSYNLYTANKIYIQKDYPIEEQFIISGKQVYQSDVETIDFRNTVEAANKMNHWVEMQTNDKIKKLISSDNLDDMTRAVLINALYFKSNWSRSFAPIGKKPFYTTPTKNIDVETLHHDRKSFNYYECPHLQAQLLELPFKGNEVSMVIVLPKEKNGLSSLENKLDLVFSHHNFEKKNLNVYLPQFKFESSINLKPILENLGVIKIFTSSADLSGISSKGDLYISETKQKTFIGVNRWGVEAAAATFAEATLKSAPRPADINFVADHPFIFYIKMKDLILFAGRVTDPSRG